MDSCPFPLGNYFLILDYTKAIASVTLGYFRTISIAADWVICCWKAGFKVQIYFISFVKISVLCKIKGCLCDAVVR